MNQTYETETAVKKGNSADIKKGMITLYFLYRIYIVYVSPIYIYIYIYITYFNRNFKLHYFIFFVLSTEGIHSKYSRALFLIQKRLWRLNPMLKAFHIPKCFCTADLKQKKLLKALSTKQHKWHNSCLGISSF